MPPKPFYVVNPQAYLFGKANETPEEKVRQWVIFELLSTYGICINNLEIERQVKVGTRNHRADIVILRENAPYVVIECKRWDDKKKKQGGMQQALSYADANTMKARFAVYTNGDAWEVKRKMGNKWVDITDFPKRVDGDYLIGLDELVRAINDFKPALYWLNQSVPPTAARAYFSCLQVLFNGTSYPLNYLDKDLCFGTDNLLRVISARGEHPDYLHGKMIAACDSLSSFFKSRLGQGWDSSLKDDDLRRLTITARMKVERLVDNTRDLMSDEVLHLRFVATLLQYLFRQIQYTNSKKNLFPEIPAVLTREFQNLIGYLFQIHLNVSFPDPVLEESCTDLRHFCCEAWERFTKEYNR